MKKAKVTVFLEVEPWREFRAECIRRGFSASNKLGKIIGETLHNWRKDGDKKRA